MSQTENEILAIDATESDVESFAIRLLRSTDPGQLIKLAGNILARPISRHVDDEVADHILVELYPRFRARINKLISKLLNSENIYHIDHGVSLITMTESTDFQNELKRLASITLPDWLNETIRDTKGAE